MSDIAVQFKIKNARLLRALRASEGFVSVVGFARRFDLSYQILIDYLALRRSPISKDGEWNKSALDIANALFADPGDLWPDALRIVVSKTTGEFEVSIDEARQIAGHKVSIDRHALRLLASSLSPREARVIAGFANGETQEAIGKELGVKHTRVMQIRNRAIRRMQTKARAERLTFRDVIDLDGDR